MTLCFFLLLGVVVLNVVYFVQCSEGNFDLNAQELLAGKDNGYHSPADSGSRSCCEALSESLGGKILSTYARASAYSESLETYWSARESEVKPACIVKATSTEDVAEAVFIMSTLNKEIETHPPYCQFAVRGGGHTPWPGAANIQNGITIDLSEIDTIEVSEDKSLVKIGGGQRWGNVYAVLDANNLAIAGGRVSRVGVAGLILGGGISFFSTRYGFVCDNVESYELVGPYGTISNVTAESDSDLFRALKGGGNNFGIVTHFRMRAFESGEIWGGWVFSNQTVAEESFKRFEKIAGSDAYDEHAAIVHSVTYSNGTGFSVSELWYTKIPAENEPPEFLKEMVDIGPSLGNTLRIAHPKSFTDEIDAYNAVGLRDSYTTLSFHNDAGFMREFHHMVKDLAATLELTVPGFTIAISFQAIPQMMTSRSASTGGNVLGFSPEDGTIVNILCFVTWNNAESDAIVDAAMQDLFTRGNEKAAKMGVAARQLYLNYAAPWQDVISGYGQKNVEFLRRVSKKHDPDGVFQKAVPGGFKLWPPEETGSTVVKDEL